MRYLLTFISLLFTTFIFSQAWLEISPDERRDARYTLPEYQAMFENYWQGKDIELGYYYENGKKKKAYGWKQFRRWEHFWESRVNLDGSFPSKRQIAEANSAYRAHKSRSSEGNWINLGPSSSNGGYAGVGRINQIAFHPTDPNTFWVTTPQGGLWTTENDGESWRPLTEEIDNLTSSAIAIPSDYEISQTIYLGTGEMDSWQYDNGIGLLKSTDGGQTWQTTGLTYDVTESVSVNRILIHPDDDTFLYAGTTKGIYISEDAGETWEMIYEESYISDMEFDPSDPSVVFASNKQWGRIYKITGDGSDVRMVYNNYSNGSRRVELAVAPSSPNIIYAVVSDTDGGLKNILKSEDSGESYQAVFVSEASSSKPNLLTWAFDGADTGGQGDYDLALVVDPNDHNTVYCAGINNWRSTDGGVTWQIVNYWTGSGGSGVQTVHADKHFMKYNGDILYECNDGGLYKSYNGTDWDNISNGIRNSQIYKIGVSQTKKDDIIAGLQDNGTKSYVNGQWYDVIGGDGMDCMIDHKDENIQYGELYYGYLRRTRNHWNNRKSIQPEGSDGAWVTPLAMHPVDPSTIYAGYQHVYKSTDQGDNWDIIFNKNSGSRFRTLAIAPSNPDIIYAGESQELWKTTDDGENWTEITAGLPSHSITGIAVDDDNPDRLWVTLGGYNNHGIYESTNGGINWKNISTGIPNIPVNTVVHNAQNDEITELYVGTDFGVYFRLGEGNWSLFINNMPKVVITNLEIYYDDIPANSRLRAATYGRGLWETDLYSIDAPPFADFVADKTEIKLGQTVNFTDMTTNAPYVWQWYFEGGTPETSTEINPSVSYNVTGVYTVELRVSNGTGTDTLIKEDYIIVNCGDELNYIAEKAQNYLGLYQTTEASAFPIGIDNTDDDNSDPIPIGFEFEYNCERFSHFILNTNGLIKLGDTPPSSTALYFDSATGNQNGPFTSEDPADQFLLAPFNHDLTGNENASYTVHYAGEAPYRVCTIEFRDLKDKSDDSVNQLESIEFQVKLYETSNIIEFVYGNWVTAGITDIFRSAACGLKGKSSKEADVLLVNKASFQNWSAADFENAQYLAGEHSFNVGSQEMPQPEPGRTFRFVPRYFKDLQVKEIYALSESPGEFANPETIQAAIRNSGYNDMHDVVVALEIGGANNFQTEALIDVIPAGTDGIVSFESLAPSSYGLNEIQVSLGDDEFNDDNTSTSVQFITRYDYNYAEERKADNGWGVDPSEGGIFATKFNMHGNAYVTKINAYIFNDEENIDQQVVGVVLNNEGEIIASSDTIMVELEHLDNWLIFELNEPVLVKENEFYAGISALPNESEDFYTLLGVQEENPTRPATYFSGTPNGDVLDVRQSDFGYKYMIGASVKSVLLEGYTASTNDSLLCYGDKGRVSIDSKPDGMEWQVSTTGIGNWQEPEGGLGLTNRTYLTDNLYADQYFRVMAPIENEAIAYSNVVHLSVNDEYSVEDSATICSGDDYLFADGKLVENITADMNYSSILKTIYGCDSIIRTTIEVLPAPYVLETDTICKGESYVFADGTMIDNILADTIYEIAFPLVNGCDSVEATQVIVRLAGNTIIEADSTLIAQLDAVSYQWIDCETGLTIEGANGKEFVPIRSGSYAVIVSDGACSDTSACIQFIHSNTSEQGKQSIRVFPNPAKDKIHVHSSQSIIHRIRAYDITGNVILQVEMNRMNVNEAELSLDKVPSGVLLLEILTDRGVDLRKVIVDF